MRIHTLSKLLSFIFSAGRSAGKTVLVISWLPTSLLILAAITAYGQRRPVPLSRWQSYPLPAGEQMLQAYNQAEEDWTVFLTDDHRLYVTDDDDATGARLPFAIAPKTKGEQFALSGRRSVLRVSDGYLVGYNRGEWGGNLFWFSANGKQRYELSNHKIVQFAQREEAIYAIQGLAHLSVSEGSLLRLQLTNGRWTAADYLQLPAAPRAMAPDGQQRLIIVTTNSLLAVDTLGGLQVLIGNGFWEGLYPSSLVILHNVAYIGMRKGVFRYDLATRAAAWLMPGAGRRRKK